MKKRILSFVLALVMLIGMAPLTVSAAETVASGTCGTSVTWTLNDEGTLTISGEGTMYDWNLLNKEEIPWYAWRNSITKVIVNQGVTSIGESAFCNCANLKEVLLSDGITKINTFAFYGCQNMDKIELPTSLQTVGTYIFSGCSKLKEITMDPEASYFTVVDNVLYSKNVSVLYACAPAKETVVIPNTVKQIETTAFNDCFNIVELAIPESVTKVDIYAICDCERLERINIYGDTSLSCHGIDGCDNLLEINSFNSTKYSSVDGVLYNSSKTVLIRCPNAKTEISIPETVRTIGEDAFYKCENLNEIILPEGLTTISNGAFISCGSLDSIVIPQNVTGIEKYVFSNCSSLKTIQLPSGIDSIGYWAFYGCRSLKHILFEGSQGIWKNVSLDDAEIPENAAITYNYAPGVNYHVYEDSQDSNCNICNQLRLVGCINKELSIEITTNKNYDYVLADAALNKISVRFTGQSSIIWGAQERHCKGYALTFNQPGAYELIFIQETTGDSVVFTAEITDHNWTLKNSVQPTCVDNGYDVYSCSYCAANEQRYTADALSHTEVIDQSVEATCTTAGKTEGKHCSVCGMVTVAQQTESAKGHSWTDATCTAPKTCSTCGATEGAAKGHSWRAATCKAPKTCRICGEKTGKIAPHTYDDIVDGTCNVCSVKRENVEIRQVVHMFRMYNPNTGEHFYTGSTVERDNLIEVGWQYEGVGFTFPANTGAPVYRLFHEPTGEHLYTMDKAEKEKLEAEGWNYEGIAFNSAYNTEAVQHRLHNPNATVGAYHFTFSLEEKQNLIDAGWEYQGIGWYSCWK